jgi:hypothetical protein
MTRVLLIHPHTHAGKPCAPGDRIEVDAASAAWLLAQGVAEHDSKPEPAKPGPNHEPDRAASSMAPRTGSSMKPETLKEPKP